MPPPAATAIGGAIGDGDGGIGTRSAGGAGSVGSGGIFPAAVFASGTTNAAAVFASGTTNAAESVPVTAAFAAASALSRKLEPDDDVGGGVF